MRSHRDEVLLPRNDLRPRLLREVHRPIVWVVHRPMGCGQDWVEVVSAEVEEQRRAQVATFGRCHNTQP